MFRILGICVGSFPAMINTLSKGHSELTRLHPERCIAADSRDSSHLSRHSFSGGGRYTVSAHFTRMLSYHVAQPIPPTQI